MIIRIDMTFRAKPLELFKLFSRYPIFLMHRTAYCLDLVPVEIFTSDVKASHITDLTRIVFSVPVAGNLNGILFI